MVKKSLIPPVREDVDLSRIDLGQYERCPLCGHLLKRKLSDARLAANRENLQKRKSKGGRPKKGGAK